MHIYLNLSSMHVQELNVLVTLLQNQMCFYTISLRCAVCSGLLAIWQPSCLFSTSDVPGIVILV